MQNARAQFTMALLAMTLAGCAGNPSALKKVHLVLTGTRGNMAYLPDTISEQLGFYREEGLDLIVDSVNGGSKGMQALLGGSADVVIGYYEHSIRVAAQGRRVRSFVTMTRYPGNVLIVSPMTKKKIERIQDLKGALVGVPDPSSQAHLFVNFLLVRHGLSPADITPVAVGTQAGGIAAFEHGKVDVWAGFEPGITQILKRHPNARILADAREQAGVREIFGAETYPGAVLYSTADWLNGNRDAAVRLARSIQRSLRWIHDHSPEKIASQVPASYRGPDDAVYIEALRRTISAFSEDGVMPADAAEVARQTLALSMESVRTAKIDLSNTYTNEFVQQKP